jgi:hypothetical protein
VSFVRFSCAAVRDLVAVADGNRADDGTIQSVEAKSNELARTAVRLREVNGEQTFGARTPFLSPSSHGVRHTYDLNPRLLRS